MNGKLASLICVSGDLGLISFSVMYFEREQLKSEYNYVELRTEGQKSTAHVSHAQF